MLALSAIGKSILFRRAGKGYILHAEPGGMIRGGLWRDAAAAAQKGGAIYIVSPGQPVITDGLFWEATDAVVFSGPFQVGNRRAAAETVIAAAIAGKECLPAVLAESLLNIEDARRVGRDVLPALERALAQDIGGTALYLMLHACGALGEAGLPLLERVLSDKRGQANSYVRLAIVRACRKVGRAAIPLVELIRASERDWLTAGEALLALDYLRAQKH